MDEHQTNINSVHGPVHTGSGNIINKVVNVITGDNSTRRQQRNRQMMLERVSSRWIEGVFQESLYHDVLIQLEKETRPDAVQQPWKNQVQEAAKHAPRSIPKDKPALEIFDETNGALLILGSPGSGKTMTLLELARDAIQRAENDQTQPIPVILNLSSWGAERQELVRWCIAELNLKYQIPKKIARQWLDNDELLLLLDGLDEVPATQREACLEAINQFRQEHGLAKIVVCCRIEEYRQLAARLKLEQAIFLHALRPEHIEQYLATTVSEHSTLPDALRQDPALWELAQSPLMLNIIIRSYHQMTKRITEEKTDLLETQNDTRQRVFNAYIKRMLSRRSAEQPYSAEQTKCWLSWLARQMAQHGQSEFFLEDIQPTWLATPLQRFFYHIAVRLIGGAVIVLTFMLAAGLLHLQQLWASDANTLPDSFVVGFVFVGIIMGIAFELASVLAIKLPHWLTILGTVGIITLPGGISDWNLGIVLGLLCGLPGAWAGVAMGSRNRIHIVERLTWSWRNALLKGGGLGILMQVCLALLFKLVLAHSPYFAQTTLRDVLEAGLFPLLACFAIFGLSRRELLPESRIFPNQGIKRSASNAVKLIGVMLLTGIVFMLVFAWLNPGGSLVSSLVFGLLLGLVSGLPFGLSVGGAALIQHVLARCMLILNGKVPLNFVNFLEYSVERIFLRKVGGGYIFIHRMLLEHFTMLEDSTNKG